MEAEEDDAIQVKKAVKVVATVAVVVGVAVGLSQAGQASLAKPHSPMVARVSILPVDVAEVVDAQTLKVMQLGLEGAAFFHNHQAMPTINRKVVAVGGRGGVKLQIQQWLQLVKVAKERMQ